ncbi:MAG TPA: tetratricopeptide repeat protein [Myxococcota bacterium]|nr:tetratricopeptide repeat protein [Myxococcota bacterium]
MRRALGAAFVAAALACGDSREPSAPTPPTRTTAPRPAPSAPTGQIAAPSEPPGAAAVPMEYAGRAACAACHPAEKARFEGSDHDLAMQEASAANALGDFGGREVADGGERATFSRRGERLVVRTPGSDGAAADYEVRWLFGVDPLQQLLLPLDRGRLQALQLAWDARPATAGGQRWLHLRPDERARPGDALHWTGRLFTWNGRCADCHSTGVRRGYDPAARTYATTFAELDVSCEACHGPGAEHVAWARARGAGTAAQGGPAGGGAADPRLAVRFPRGGRFELAPGAAIATRVPARRDTAELDACGPCHARRGVLADPAPPGRPFEDDYRLALLEEGLYFADGQIHDEVFELGSFLQSPMARAGVACSDCHEPHAGALRAEGNALCTTCHRAEVFDASTHHFHEPGSAGAQCTACHMPERVSMRMDRRHDHSFPVPRPDLAARLGTPEPCTGCHPGRDAAWAAEVVRARGGRRGGAWHFAEALTAGRRYADGAEALLVRAAGDADVPPIARATALVLLAGFPSAEGARIVERALADPDALVRRAAVGWLAVAPPAPRAALAAPLLRDPVRGVRLEAARVLADAPPAALGARTPELERALEEYRAAQRAAADAPESWLNLGLLAAARGDLAAAERDFAAALELAPEHGGAAVNLADVHRAQGRDEDAERVLRAALARSPDDPGLHHALGLALVRLGRAADALPELERAASLAPDEPRYAYVLGVALHDGGDPERGIGVLRAAAARFPAHRELAAAVQALALPPGPP